MQPGQITPEHGAQFNQFWAEYWVKTGRKAAERAFAKQVTTTDRFEQVMAAVRAQKPRMLRRINEGKTPKYAEGWLNDHRWEDENEFSPEPVTSRLTCLSDYPDIRPARIPVGAA
jgi:hypothetical protein